MVADERTSPTRAPASAKEWLWRGHAAVRLRNACQNTVWGPKPRVWAPTTVGCISKEQAERGFATHDVSFIFVVASVGGLVVVVA